MNTLTPYRWNTIVFSLGKTDYRYSYKIPIIKKKGDNYNSGYRAGYQQALDDLKGKWDEYH